MASVKAGCRFKPSSRVRKRTEYLRAQENGRKFRSNHFLLFVLPRASGHSLDAACEDKNQPLEKKDSAASPLSRLGVTVTRKVDKRAVQRNLIKRRWREFFRRRLPQVREGFDIVVIALTGANTLEHADFVKEANYIFRRAELFTSYKNRQTTSSFAPILNKPRLVTDEDIES